MRGDGVRNRFKEAAREAFQGLPMPQELTLESLTQTVSDLRGRPIYVIETPKLTGKRICGLWIPKPEMEVVYHAEARGPLHRQQLVLHELSHMILHHDDQPGVNGQGIQVFKQISGETVHKALARGDFQSDMEVTAEYLADMLAAALRDAKREIHSYEEIFE